MHHRAIAALPAAPFASSLNEASTTVSSERFLVALFMAVVIHTILILGVTFAPQEPERATTNTLDVVLVQSRSEQAPSDADYLAQANQEGGGNQPDKARPAVPLPAPLSSPMPRVVAASPPTSATKPGVAWSPPNQPTSVPEERTKSRRVLAHDKATATQPPVRESNRAATSREASEVVERPKPSPEQPPTQTVTAAALVSRSLEAAATLSAELDQRLEAYAKRPRRKFISARTREYKYASYMEAWRAKVERIGNLNYPDEARRRKLSGSLLLGVALNPNGTINDIVLRRSSGSKILDDAAVRIVKLAAPFAPFPQSIRAETDILHIERTWRFLRNNRLAAR